MRGASGDCTWIGQMQDKCPPCCPISLPPSSFLLEPLVNKIVFKTIWFCHVLKYVLCKEKCMKAGFLYFPSLSLSLCISHTHTHTCLNSHISTFQRQSSETPSPLHCSSCFSPANLPRPRDAEADEPQRQQQLLLGGKVHRGHLPA